MKILMGKIRSLVNKVKHFLANMCKWCYTFCLKKRFDHKLSKLYIYDNEIFCDSKKIFDKIVLKYKNEKTDYWALQSDYSLSKIFPDRYQKRKKIIFKHFLPLFDKKPDIVDIGCASGEWDAKLAPFCHKIEGYEYSTKMVETAKERWKKIKNISFYQADINSVILSHNYDGAMVIGVFVYVFEDEVLYRILRNIYDHLNWGGILLVEDTLNCEKKDAIYVYNKIDGYNAIYRSWDKYKAQFERAGFVLKEDVVTDKVSSKWMHVMGKSSIWEKVKR